MTESAKQCSAERQPSIGGRPACSGARAFFDLADRLTRTSDTTEQKQLKEELARMTFGES